MAIYRQLYLFFSAIHPEIANAVAWVYPPPEEIIYEMPAFNECPYAGEFRNRDFPIVAPHCIG
jgi:hypothetical protein